MNSTATKNGRVGAPAAAKASAHGYEDARGISLTFIHNALDDFGLNPYQFRVYCRIARRAGDKGCFETVKNMADGCQMSEKQIKRSLAELITLSLISRHSRPGTTNIYRLEPPENWKKPHPTEFRSKRGSHNTSKAGQSNSSSQTQGITDPPYPGHNRPITQGITDLPTQGITDPQSKSILSISLLSQINQSDGLEKENEEEKSFASDQNKVVPNSRPVVKKIKNSRTGDKTPHEDRLRGAASENDSQIFGFSNDPIKEPDFLSYYRSYQKTQGKEIKNVASYVATILSKKDEGSSEVELLFKEWQVACRTVGRKISNFAENPEQIERQRQKFGFEGWKEWKHHAYYDRLLSEGLAKFRTHEVSARWYEWALAKYPDRFADIPM